LAAWIPSQADVVKAKAAAEQLATMLQHAMLAIRRRARDVARLRRLEAIQEIANQWNPTRELAPLLVQMAEAAARLLRADRASIFLWDRQNHVLVGRPALGLPDGELRIPDDRGVVGQVIHSGETRRVDAATEPEAIDHQVDAKLRYQTRTLLCVPLRGSSGELFGAFELINKQAGPFTEDDEEALTELAAHAAVALENAQDRRQLLATNRQIADQAAEKVRLIGESPAIEALRSIIRRVADTDLAVLILGENGTGKEVVAKSIHYLSRRRNQPFIAVNCAAIPETLAESELFGHEKGAFTDAREARPGKFELAAGGTLFLDEIGDLSLSSQSKLLRVLEEKTLVRVGGSTPIHTDARLLAATNQNLAEMVRAKRFREDLYFRLNVVTLDLPPLRERGGDVLLLADFFLNDFCRQARRKPLKWTAAARKRLIEHAWPGNVRELRNLMERLAYLSAEEQIEAEDLAFILAPHAQTPLVSDFTHSLADATNRFQIEYIRKLIEQSDGNMTLAATRLGLHRSNLYRKMRQLGMECYTVNGRE
jgi:Nif-specific regulatory protein